MENIPFIAYESAMARQDKANRRLWVLCIVLTVLLILSNGMWIYYESQFVNEYQIEQEVETGMGDAYVSGIGNINGENQTDR